MSIFEKGSHNPLLGAVESAERLKWGLTHMAILTTNSLVMELGSENWKTTQNWNIDIKPESNPVKISHTKSNI